MNDKLVERVARAIMLSRNEPGCAVVDWKREALDNPHVGQAMRQAKAALEAAGVAGLVEALRPFAKLGEYILSEAPADAETIVLFTSTTGEKFSVGLNVFRDARTALAKALGDE